VPEKKKRTVVPRLRFPEFRDAGPWEVVPLHQLATRRTRRNKNGMVTRVLTNSAEHGVVDQRDFFDKDIPNKDLSITTFWLTRMILFTTRASQIWRQLGQYQSIK
jgi:hypothetical protein